MELDIPNRDGWVTGALAELPPCPPFPEFTDFEQRALDSIAALFDADEDVFRRQIAAARVVDRINTIVGFYARVIVDRSKCQPLNMRAKGGHFEVEGIEHGMGVVLWEEDGYLNLIEGFTYSDSPLEGVDLAELKFIRLVQLG
ncbi:hypothetical protein LJR225_000746 [Phenylobacterium sp. LjRoot225]|uniref:hypothetical protein n=1 Tax=Phenylobacterium sp. LjRoot225 TaxID=3342285 RepID=UPI003ECC8776